MRIAICGPAGSGKSTLANHLVENYGFVKYSFAATIKDLARELFDMEDKDRSLLQAIGGQMRMIDPEVWVRYAMNQIEGDAHENVVIDDLRHTNEALWCRANDFAIVKLHGRGYRMTDAQMNHPSEQEIQKIVPDFLIDCSKTITESSAILDDIVSKLALGWLTRQLEYFRNVKAHEKSNKNYKRGRDFEYRTMRFLREHGWHCMRKFGSHNDKYKLPDGSILDVPLDVTAFKNGVYLLISCKYSINGPTDHETDPLWENLKRYATFFGKGAIPILAGIDEKRHLRLIDLREITPFDSLAKSLERNETRGRKKKLVDIDQNQMDRLLQDAWDLMETLKWEYDQAKDQKNDSLRVRWAGEKVKLINILNRLLKSAGDTATEEDITTMLEKLDEAIQLKEAETDE